MSSILGRTPLLVSRRQARQLAAWAKGTGYAQVSFNSELLEGVILAVMPEGSIRIMLAPSVGGDSASAHAWWVMSDDERVVGLIVPMRMALGSSNHPDEDGLPKPYEAKEGDK